MSGNLKNILMKHKSPLEDLIPHVYAFLTEDMLEVKIQNLTPKKLKLKLKILKWMNFLK